MTSHTVYLSIGSNMGDRLRHCRLGIEALTRLPETRLTGSSGFYETEPVDYLEQDWFVNAAVRIETGLEPLALLDEIKRIESSCGRKAGGIRFGPRPLDIDIILYDDWMVDTPRLTIPHPRMHQRRFVLRPICDIDPHVVHPVMCRSVRQLMHALKDEPRQDIVDLK